MNEPIAVPKVGAVIFPRCADVDAVMAEVVRELRRRGIDVAGLLQHRGEQLPNGRCQRWIETIATGHRMRLDQPLGLGSLDCALDPDVLARAASDLLGAIGLHPAILVVSRFGSSEAKGGGMRAEIAEALCSGVPVLIAVRDDFVEAFELFLGGASERLRPEARSVLAWTAHAMDRSAAA